MKKYLFNYNQINNNTGFKYSAFSKDQGAEQLNMNYAKKQEKLNKKLLLS